MISSDAAGWLGRIRWRDGKPSLMGRPLTVESRVQVFVKVPGGSINDAQGEGLWLDAEVVDVRDPSIELRTSFARFRAEDSLACRWPPDAPPLTRRELEITFADSVADVSTAMLTLVEQFKIDPRLRKSPLEPLLGYAGSIRECSRRIVDVAALMEGVAQELSDPGDRSKLVVGQARPDLAARRR